MQKPSVHSIDYNQSEGEMEIGNGLIAEKIPVAASLPKIACVLPANSL
jgi:hypothetical protein